MQNPGDLPGTAGPSGKRCDAAIGQHPSMGNVLNDMQGILGESGQHPLNPFFFFIKHWHLLKKKGMKLIFILKLCFKIVNP
jgi:hypothetical protein